jgi:WD40 repeat protein
VIGTNSGKIYQANIQTGEVMAVFTPHTKKVNCLFVKEGSVIISCSNDGTIKITSLCPEFDHLSIDTKEFELTCFTLRTLPFNHSTLDFFCGTSQGKMFFYYNGWFDSQKELIQEDKEEGMITNILCYNDIVTWSTMHKIRVIHYSRRQKICLIE